MPATPPPTENRPTWFLGSSIDGEDRTADFLKLGIWEVKAPTNHERALVQSTQAGDRVAIKAAFVQKEFAFNPRRRPVSVLRIKATGVVRRNPQDGERIEVEWDRVGPPRDWYFYTYRSTIWRVVPGAGRESDGLIDFAFAGKPQDIDHFLAMPKWRQRLGIVATDKPGFAWTAFYEAVADKLLGYRLDRTALVEGIRKISLRVDGLNHLSEDQYADGTTGFVRDICPFTAMGIFNRGTTIANRKKIAAELAAFLGVDVPVPETFEAIPLLNNLNSWYFPWEKDRSPDHIGVLWEVFAAGLSYADNEEEHSRAHFAAAFDDANGRHNVGWNLTFGLYWARPWAFLSLEQSSRTYIGKKLNVPIPLNGPERRCNAHDYLTLMDRLEAAFEEPAYPAHSYPELSLEAYRYREPANVAAGSPGSDDAQPPDPTEEEAQVVTLAPYTVDDICADGCFIERVELARMLDRLRDKKNLILQGPPGTGKTWLAKRLGLAMVGSKDTSRLRAVQFHPNLSYEDFVRGWRPGSDGKLAITDGVFLEAVKVAVASRPVPYVVVIEEINRGNPAQVFGELLTLIEAGKRTPLEALDLSYPDKHGRRDVYIPDNLYVIGTMNVADRSLALVDLALRRRFAFIDLHPALGERWRQWVARECGIDDATAAEIERRMAALNAGISGDRRLGKQFRIGHSYVTPTQRLDAGVVRDWFRDVVDTEIGPLLEEYWFDDPDAASEARRKLLQDW